MPGDSGVTVVTMLVCFLHFAREAAGASCARHSLRPLMFKWAGRSQQNSRAHAARSRSCGCGCLKIESGLSSSAKADDPVRRGVSALWLNPVEYWIPRLRGV